jgi:hypothetical protein
VCYEGITSRQRVMDDDVLCLAERDCDSETILNFAGRDGDTMERLVSLASRLCAGYYVESVREASWSGVIVETHQASHGEMNEAQEDPGCSDELERPQNLGADGATTIPSSSPLNARLRPKYSMDSLLGSAALVPASPEPMDHPVASVPGTAHQKLFSLVDRI